MGVRQGFVMTMNGLVKRIHFNSDVISRAKEARDLHRRMGKSSDMALGNALDHERIQKPMLHPETWLRRQIIIDRVLRACKGR